MGIRATSVAVCLYLIQCSKNCKMGKIFTFFCITVLFFVINVESRSIKLRGELSKTEAMVKDLLNEVNEIFYDIYSNDNGNGPQKVDPVFMLQKALRNMKTSHQLRLGRK